MLSTQGADGPLWRPKISVCNAINVCVPGGNWMGDVVSHAPVASVIAVAASAAPARIEIVEPGSAAPTQLTRLLDGSFRLINVGGTGRSVRSAITVRAGIATSSV